jgi:GDPmannose 4,6-dehydratase
MARVLVTGIAGQIGSFLAERLVGGGHQVVGVDGAHRAAQRPGVEMVPGDLDADAVDRILDVSGALDAIVHLAGKTSVGESWSAPMATFDANARTSAALAYAAHVRGITLVNASSAEIFGNACAPVQNELTSIAPVSPYGVAKAAAHEVVRLTRDTMGARATNLIFYLGESERRSPQFVVRKITRSLARVKLGLQDGVSLGNTAVTRDFSYAGDFARAAEMFALGAPPGDYVCASGIGHTVAEVATTCCDLLGLDPAKVVRSDPALFRRADISSLVGDATKLRSLGWSPSLSFRELVRRITEYDLAEARLETA